MKILCPKCQKDVPPNQINIATDLAFCPVCNEGFKISESMDIEDADAEILTNPPKGCWYREEIDGIVVGATTRGPRAFFLIPFMLVWSGGSLGGIYGTQIWNGKFVLIQSLVGIPFLLGSIFLGILAIMSVFGKVQVKIGANGGKIFTGVGNIGWTRRFDWLSVKTIREDYGTIVNNGQPSKVIVLEGGSRLSFGTMLNDKRRYFVLKSLQYLLVKTR